MEFSGFWPSKWRPYAFLEFSILLLLWGSFIHWAGKKVWSKVCSYIQYKYHMSELYNSNNSTNILCLWVCFSFHFLEEKKNIHIYQRESLEFETLNINSGRKCTNEDFRPISVWGPPKTKKKKKKQTKIKPTPAQLRQPNPMCFFFLEGSEILVDFCGTHPFTK